MSTAVSGSGALIGIAGLPFLALAGVVRLCAHGAYKACDTLKTADAKVLEKLELNKKELENQEFLHTPEGLKSKYLEDTQRFKKVIKPFKLKPEEEQIYVHTYAMETSGLGSFLKPEQQKVYKEQGTISIKECNKLVHESVNNFKAASFDYTKKSIVEAAKEYGFNDKITIKQTLLGTHITANNSNGQSIVVLSNSSDSGIKVNADTTGFKNGECTKVMDSFLEALSKRHIRLNNFRKTEHWKSEGLLNNHIEKKEKEYSTPIKEQEVMNKKSKKHEARRKKHYFFTKNRNIN
ncbi:MAG: hypothetical protein ACFFG0_05145 [Candidatus Thorarchaeota archaeon]